jgi:hypothetical protein
MSAGNGVSKTLSGSLVVLLLITAAVFLAGAVQKAPCADRSFVEQRTGVGVQCYSDVATLRLNEQLDNGRLPYLDPCAPSTVNCDEYPPVSVDEDLLAVCTALAEAGGLFAALAEAGVHPAVPA